MKSLEKPVPWVLEPEILYTLDVAELLLTAKMLIGSVLSSARPDAKVEPLVKSKIRRVLPDTFVGFVVVHVKVFDPEVIWSPTSNVVDWPVMENEENVGS